MIPRYRRMSLKGKAILCVFLIGNLNYWMGGCGQSALTPENTFPDGAVRIPLTPEHPIRQALAGSQFDGAVALLVNHQTGSFELIFPDVDKQVSGKFVGDGPIMNITEFTFSRIGHGVTLRLDPNTRQVTLLTTTDGFEWRPTSLASARGDTSVDYISANAELLKLEEDLVKSGNAQFQPAFLAIAFA